MNLHDLIDTRYGTSNRVHLRRPHEQPWGFGNTVPGPCLPHGSIHPSPNTPGGRTNGYIADAPVRGFGQLHVSGTGGPGQYGWFLLSPQLGLSVGRDAHDSPVSDVISRPGYYAATLDTWNIRVEITVAHHAALYRITWPDPCQASLVWDFSHSVPVDIRGRQGHLEDAWIAYDEDRRGLAGWVRHRGGWGVDRAQAHVYAMIDQVPKRFGMFQGQDVLDDRGLLVSDECGARLGAFWQGFDRSQVIVRVGVSFQSVGRARRACIEETCDGDFDRLRQRAEQTWEKALSVIEIDTPDPVVERKFYGALRNAMIMPRDRSGDDPHRLGKPRWDEQYCVWDTFRTLLPLLTLIREDDLRSILESFAVRCEQGHPVMDAFINGQELLSQSPPDGTRRYAGGMGGDMVDVVLADAYAKGVEGLDWGRLFPILRHHAEHGRCDPYRVGDRGWIPSDQLENCNGLRLRHASSYTLEMAYTDWCAARVAAGLGDAALAQRLERRAGQWPILFNPGLIVDGHCGFISARRSDGTFDDAYAQADNGAFAESLIWHYQHFVPHDMQTLVRLHGGEERFIRKMEHFRTLPGHGLENETTFLLVHSLIYAGGGDRTARWMREYLQQGFINDTYPGEDDSGAMASLFVLGCMGLMPQAGQDLYLLHAPLVREAVIHRPQGDLRILAPKAPQGSYIQSVRCGNAELPGPWVGHRQWLESSDLEFSLTDAPRGFGHEHRPPTA